MNRTQTPIIVLVLAAFAALYFEFQTVSEQIDAILTGRSNNENKKAELVERKTKLDKLKENLPLYEEAFEQLLSGCTDSPLPSNQFNALYSLNPTIKARDTVKNQGRVPTPSGPNRAPGQLESAWTYDFSSSSIEFHKFLPALAETENSIPLFRFTKLTVTSPQEPFFTEATALNITGTMTTLRAGALLPKKAGK
jgi:hypothetical protein